jgi:hypothetical protein
MLSYYINHKINHHSSQSKGNINSSNVECNLKYFTITRKYVQAINENVSCLEHVILKEKETIFKIERLELVNILSIPDIRAS